MSGRISNADSKYCEPSFSVRKSHLPDSLVFWPHDCEQVLVSRTRREATALVHWSSRAAIKDALQDVWLNTTEMPPLTVLEARHPR